MEKGLLEKTGHPLSHWIEVVKRAGIKKHSEMIKFLKADHGFTHGYANFVAMKARGADAASADPDDLIEAQYSKGKEALKPIYQLLVEKISAIGEEIEFVPKKSSVSVRTKKQFVLIQPSTKSRIDLGLKLRHKATEGRLEGSGPFGSMCTHRVQLFAIEDVDEELMGWIKEAYAESW